MKPLPPSHRAPQALSAVAAVIVCVAIGASIEGLARHYASDAERPASTARAAASAPAS